MFPFPANQKADWAKRDSSAMEHPMPKACKREKMSKTSCRSEIDSARIRAVAPICDNQLFLNPLALGMIYFPNARLNG